ncbi:MAG: family 43 glycosylhydrolase [Anaerolineae bacterium]|nr:family 43 glycosylhydrolase [Anaerolineae bacterium]
MDRDFPDPDVLRVGNTFYAFATNTENINIQVASSSDLTHWELIGDALPALPTWAVQEFGFAWAPEVTTNSAGSGYLMYFVARFAIDKGGTQCIGVATSDQPEGPYQTVGDPLVCQVSQGGSIDPATFVDSDGKRYLLWKNDGNSGNGQSWLHIQQLADDGLSLLDQPTKLITADQVWEGVLVEAPTLWKHDNKYYLFYSANAYNTPEYAVGYAVADAATGPYTKAEKPFLKRSVPAGLVGPGGQDIVLDDAGTTWLLYHNWAPGGYRRLNLLQVDWIDGVPSPAALTRDPQPIPVIGNAKS